MIIKTAHNIGQRSRSVATMFYHVSALNEEVGQLLDIFSEGQDMNSVLELFATPTATPTAEYMYPAFGRSSAVLSLQTRSIDPERQYASPDPLMFRRNCAYCNVRSYFHVSCRT